MTNLGYLIVCDEVFNAPDGNLILKQPLGMIVPLALPTNYTFMISVGLINLVKGQVYQTLVELTDPAGKVIWNNTIEFEIDDPEQHADAVTSGGFNMYCKNIGLEVAGDYTITAKIGTEEKQLVLPVIKKQS